MKILALFVLTAAAFGCTNSSDDLTPRASPLVGTWTGYVEGFAFPSGSDQIQFAIAAHDEETGAVTGTVTFGEGTPLPPATDPNVGYPSDIGPISGRLLPDVYEAVAYSLVDALLEEARFRASYERFEVWTDWCGLQIAPPAPGSECFQGWAGNQTAITETEYECTIHHPDTGAEIPIDCSKWNLCRAGVCACSGSTCTHEGSDRVAFDIALDGEIADGTVTGTWGTHNVRLERLP